MKIEIKIPEEFEEQFYKHKFSQNFDGIMALTGNYEKEIIEMLKTAFKEAYIPKCCANCVFFYCEYCISSNGMEFEREVKKTDHCSRWRKR